VALGIPTGPLIGYSCAMSLRTKFSIVLALLVFTLAINVALSIWSLRFLERELAWPLRSAQPVLASMHQIKRMGEQEAAELGIGRTGVSVRIEGGWKMPDATSAGARVVEIEKGIGEELAKLESLPTVLVRSGVSTTQNLRDRSNEILKVAEGWMGSGDTQVYEQLVDRIELRHELIERVEGRILQDAELAASYGQKLTIVILSIIVVSVAGALASAIFAGVLIRRWIIGPVGELREGARRFGRGEFEHRIEIRTSDELGQLGEEFNHMSSLIKAMQDERVERERMAAVGEMAQRTVHNLRTPLAGIRALAETTKGELDPNSDLHEIQDRILSTVDRFELWLQGMLRVSSPLELAHCAYQPGKLVEGVVESHRDAARSKGVEIVVHDLGVPESAIGDPHHLEHAFTALLSNAIDFSPENEAIELELGSEGDYWTASIRDHGCGIDPDLHVAIFRPYFTTRQSGTGIGLAMVKRIITQHLGSVDVESPVDPVSASGTAFMVRIRVDAQTKEVGSVGQ